MESSSAPGMENLTSVRGHDEDWPNVVNGDEGFVDIETLSGNHLQTSRLETESLYDDDLIGVSISRVQTQMRSPETPVAEKARALNLPVEYFQRISTLAEENEKENEDTDENDSQPQTPGSGSRPPTLFLAKRSESPEPMKSELSSRDSWSPYRQERHYGQTVEQPNLSFDETNPSQAPKVEDQRQFSPLPRRSDNDVPQLDGSQQDSPSPHPHRLSITKSFLSTAGNERRRRSSSGPTAILSNLRKLLADLPSSHFNRSSISLLPLSNKSSGQQTPISPQPAPTTRSFRWSIREPIERRSTGDSTQGTGREQATADDLATGSRPNYGLDGNVDSLLTPISPASTKSRNRSNSESSLYIRRFSEVSDDFSAFANVTDMANSRFKAITDSFQNSTLKLPKLPAIRPTMKHRISPGQSDNGITRRIDEVPAGTDDRVPNNQYASVKKLRNAKKGVGVETPQQRAHPVLSQALSKTTGDIVVLGGYRGSILRSAQPPHRQLWVPMKVGLNLRKVDLEVGLTREDEERMEETIIPSGVLSHIGPIDICRRLLKHMKKCPNTRDNKLRVHDWGYDWRLSPDLLSGKLIKFLESLECNHPETPPEKRGATVIAHSLGGLITRHAVNQRPELFAGVVFAGVPQHCVNILGPLRCGDHVLLSSRVLTAQVNFTLRTSFALLPEDGRCFIQKHTNKRYDLNFFDPGVWEEYRLSPCINPPLPLPLKDNERRKSIIGALSDSLSTSNKRGSWFGGQPAQGSSPQSPQPSDHREMLEAASQRINTTALEAEQSMEGAMEGMVGPSMKPPQRRPTVATACTIPKDLAEDYLARTLKEVSVFKQQLKFIPSHQENNLYPPHAFIFGKTVPTVYGARVANKEAIKYSDAFDDLAFAAGDGVVLASAAQLPEGYRCVKGGRVESDRGHVGIMGDLEGMGQCLEAVVDARARGVGLGKQRVRNTSNPGGS